MGAQLDCLSAPAHDNHGQHTRVQRSQSLDSHTSKASNIFHSSFSSLVPHRERHHRSQSSHPTKDHRHRVKILFLDVDGVLNGENIGYGGVDDSLLFLLRTIILETDCKIVLSTTWRLNQQARALLLHFMKARADINVEDIIIGDTPRIKQQNRATEIETFLLSDSFRQKYVCTKWCAIDDLNLMKYDPQLMRSHFVRTNYRTGVTSKDAYKVVQILNEDRELSNSYDY